MNALETVPVTDRIVKQYVYPWSISYICTECGWSSPDMRKVRGHVGGKHGKRDSDRAKPAISNGGRLPKDPIMREVAISRKEMGKKVNALARENAKLRERIKAMKRAHANEVKALRSTQLRVLRSLGAA